MQVTIPKEHRVALRMFWFHFAPYVGILGAILYTAVQAGWIDIPAKAAEVNNLKTQIEQNQSLIKDLGGSVKDLERTIGGNQSTLEAIRRNQELILQRLLRERAERGEPIPR